MFKVLQFHPTFQQNNSRESCRISVRLRRWISMSCCRHWRISSHDGQEWAHFQWKRYPQKIKIIHHSDDRQRKGRVDGRTVNVNDFDVFVTIMQSEDSPGMLSLDLFCEDMGYFYEWKGWESPSVIKDWKMWEGATLTTMCQLWHFQKSLAYPMPLRRQASGDRFAFPRCRWTGERPVA